MRTALLLISSATITPISGTAAATMRAVMRARARVQSPATLLRCALKALSHAGSKLSAIGLIATLLATPLSGALAKKYET